jgi:hypothetical protein
MSFIYIIVTEICLPHGFNGVLGGGGVVVFVAFYFYFLLAMPTEKETR